MTVEVYNLILPIHLVFGTTGFGDGELGLGKSVGSGGNFKRAKIERKARRLCRNAQRKTPSHRDAETPRI